MDFHGLVTVVFPFFNAQNSITSALESIRNQSYEYFECLMIDNNSSDESALIAQEFAAKDPRFKYLTQKRQGVTFASNLGSQNAKGKYIARMDADDVCFPQRLELQINFLIENPEYEVVSGLVSYHSSIDFKTQGFRDYVKWVNGITTYDDILRQRFVESPIVNPSAMWLRSTEMRYGSYRNGDFPEDYEMWLRWLSHGVKMAKINTPLIQWNDAPSRLTRTHAHYRQEAFYAIKSQYLSMEIKQRIKGRKLAIWGASRTARQRAQMIESFGLTIDQYIDISTKRQLQTKVITHLQLGSSKENYVVVYVPQPAMKQQVIAFLHEKGYHEIEDYILAS